MTVVELFVLANLVASAWMAALIWAVQLLIYPAFSDVPPESWNAAHARHSTRITALVLPPMTVQLAAPIGLLLTSAASVSSSIAISMLVLSSLTWIVTVVVSAPSHQRLGAGFSSTEHRWLVRSNWIRTALWSALLVLAIVAGATLQT